jgi:hypothetical protein
MRRGGAGRRRGARRRARRRRLGLHVLHVGDERHLHRDGLAGLHEDSAPDREVAPLDPSDCCRR